MKINGINNTSFTGYAYKVFKPTPEVLREAAMGSKTKHGYYVLIAKAGKEGDNRMIDLLEKAGQQINKDYFISKTQYYPKTHEIIDINAIEQAQIEFNPDSAKFSQTKLPHFNYFNTTEHVVV